jgi:hypothetical protein
MIFDAADSLSAAFLIASVSLFDCHFSSSRRAATRQRPKVLPAREKSHGMRDSSGGAQDRPQHKHAHGASAQENKT